MSQVGILLIHGMGKPEADFGDKWKEAIQRKLPPENDYVFDSIHYSDVIQAGQTNLWRRMAMGTALPLWLILVLMYAVPVAIGLIAGLLTGWPAWLFRTLTLLWVLPVVFGVWLGSRHLWLNLRKFFLFGFSDATTYLHRARDPKSVYRGVHETVLDTVDRLRGNLSSDDTPVVVIAHSLGAHVVSNYIWDAQHSTGSWDGATPTEFQKLSTCQYIFSVGCNIPLFVSGLNKVQPIHKPNDDFEWHNYYDRDDVLGWPLEDLPDGDTRKYKDLVCDHVVSTTPPWIGWTPYAHNRYLRTGKVVNAISEKIASI